MSLRLVPVGWQDAREFVKGWHRHHSKPPPGHIFCTGVADGDTLVGVAIVGRPVARMLQDGFTLEVNRTATDGHRNANSMLYAAAWSVTKGLGYRRLVTYNQAGESGASLRAAGWRIVAERPATLGWDRPSRPRDNDSYLSTARTLWEAS
jgi:hypothetical protein